MGINNQKEKELVIKISYEEQKLFQKAEQQSSQKLLSQENIVKSPEKQNHTPTEPYRLYEEEKIQATTHVIKQVMKDIEDCKLLTNQFCIKVSTERFEVSVLTYPVYAEHSKLIVRVQIPM